MRTSVKCPECRFANWSDAENCKRCLAPLAPLPSFGAFNPMNRKLDDMSYPSYSSHVPGSFADGRVELAGRLRRFIGVLIDSILLGVSFYFFNFNQMIAKAVGLPVEDEPPLGMGLLSFLLLYTFTYFIVQIYLLMTHGQSIGKKLLSIRIVRQDTQEVGGFVTNVFVRWLIPFVIQLIPLLGLIFFLLDSLLIFRRDRRCLHDLMAGTIVVKA